MNGYWVIRTYTINGVGEKTKFFIPGERPPKKITKRVASDINKREQNAQSAVKNLARHINANFEEGDLFISLTYDAAGLAKLKADITATDPEVIREEIYERAMHELQLFFRRVSSAAKKAGVDFKYIGTTSDYDPRRDKAVRVHHHIILPAAVAEIVKQKWTFGNVHILKLECQADYLPLAEYMLRQVRHVPDRKKFVTSRNLIRPEPKDRIALNDSELRIPKGAKLIYRAEHRAGAPQYLRYFYPEQRFKNHKKAPEPKKRN